MNPFSFARCPQIKFGLGAFDELHKITAMHGNRVLLMFGGESLKKSGGLDDLIVRFRGCGLTVYTFSVKGEPSPELVDAAVKTHRDADVVVSVGGGSVLDAGKAVSAMLPSGEPVSDYLEGVGVGGIHDGRKIPFIAVPTTSGTGSEVTKNAVLSRIGPQGFKKSLRHDNFVPDIAIIDPNLTVTCPPDVTAACGMDAFTQLLESYLSTLASPMTDALALKGISLLAGSLVKVCTDGMYDTNARADAALAAMLSGITLANAGLGVVHGLAGPIGGAFNIPHGIVCGALAAAAASLTVSKLDDQHPAFLKCAKVGAVLKGYESSNDPAEGCRMAIETMEEWIELLGVPRLGAFGIKESDLDWISEEAGCKNNPVQLSRDEIKAMLKTRL